MGTTDEDSERKNDTETADLVLEVEVEGCEASNDEAEEEIGEEDEEEEVSSSRTKSVLLRKPRVGERAIVRVLVGPRGNETRVKMKWR